MQIPKIGWHAPRPEMVLWAILVLVLVAVAAGGGVSLLRRQAAETPGAVSFPPVYGEVPHFEFTERSGERVSREELLGKVWIANFIFTRCGATCPRQTGTLAQLQADLAGETEVRLVSITIDPDHDTPAVLARYAERHAADPLRWLFLTGEQEAIFALAQDGFRVSAATVSAMPQTPMDRAFPAEPGLAPDPHLAGASDPAVSKGPPGEVLVHDPRFALVDRKARIRGYYSSLDPEAVARLRRDAKALLRRR